MLAGSPTWRRRWWILVINVGSLGNRATAFTFTSGNGTSYEYEVTGGDVDEVIAWAEATAAGRTFALYACVPNDGLGLVRLLGTDPNET